MILLKRTVVMRRGAAGQVRRPTEAFALRVEEERKPSTKSGVRV